MRIAPVAMGVWIGVSVGVAAHANKPFGIITGSARARGSSPSSVVVYIERARRGGVDGHGRDAAVVAQRNEVFVPSASVVFRGQKVRFPNLDKVYHNVFSVSPGNEFDLGLYRAGAERTVRLQRPGEVDVYCNIHPQMAAKLLVLQNPFFARSNHAGTYRIRGVPPGNYTLVAWSPRHTPLRRKIRVRPGKTVRVDFKLKPRDLPASHLNKYGQPYERYR